MKLIDLVRAWDEAHNAWMDDRPEWVADLYMLAVFGTVLWGWNELVGLVH